MLELPRHLFRFLAYSIRSMSPLRLATGSVRLLADPAARDHDASFDVRFGTDTTRGMTPVEASVPPSRQRVATMYLPTRDEDFATMLAALGWEPTKLEQCTFLDLGSGKGRVVLLAAMHRFREVVGVEVSPTLNDIAIRNHALVANAGVLRSAVRFDLGDAADLAIPGGPLVVHLYHPFHEMVAEVVVSRIVMSIRRDPRPVAILYGHPTVQRPLSSGVFTDSNIFACTTVGARKTKRFSIGWSIFTNTEWLRRSRLSALRSADG